MPDWILTIDYGTTATVGAMAYRDRSGERVELVGPKLASMVFLHGDRLVVGDEADNRSGVEPWRFERTPKRRLGEATMRLGDRDVPVVDAIAAVLREVAAEAVRRRDGEPPVEVCLTHPASWGAARLDALRAAAAAAGLPDPVLMPEPVAAAVYYADERLADGEYAAVYDLGGGTFDTAVLRKAGDRLEVVGQPGGREDFGGEDIDDRLYELLMSRLDAADADGLRAGADRAWTEANRELRRRATEAKERLSDSPDYPVFVPPPVTKDVVVTADGLMDLVAADLEGTVDELARTIAAAGLRAAQIARVYLAGGSSRIPAIGALVRERLGHTPRHLDDPKSVVALGAAKARLAARREYAAPLAGGPGLSSAERTLLAGGVALLAALALTWFKLTISGPYNGLTQNGWHALGGVRLLVAAAAVAAVWLPLGRWSNAAIASEASAVAAVTALLLVGYRVALHPGPFRELQAGGALALFAAIAMTVGATRWMHANGTGFSGLADRTRGLGSPAATVDAPRAD